MFARRRAPIGAALAALALLQVPALVAQDRRTEFRTTGGTIELPAGPAEPLARGELQLAPQGAFELQVFGTRQFTKWTLKGQYVGQQWGNRIEVRLNDALGDGDAVGDGFVTFDQFNAVREVELTGRTRRGERFAVRLRGDGSGAQQPPVVGGREPEAPRPDGRPDARPGAGPVVLVTEFDRTQDGRGVFRTWTDEVRVRRLRVQLRRDGTFELRAETETGRRTVRGRWRDQGRDGVELRVLDFDGDRTDRRGLVFLRGNEILRVQVGDDRGRDGGTLRFTTDRRWDDDDWGRGGWDRDDDWGRGGRDRDDDWGRGGRPGWDVPRDYNRTLNAHGTVDVPFAGRLEVHRAELRLDRNGEARLRVQTWERGRDRRIELRGTWLPGDRNDRGTVRIRWTRIENQVADGDAVVTFWDGRDVQRLRGLGRTRDGRFALNLEFDR